MRQRIVVPLDGSVLAKSILPTVQTVAMPKTTEILLVTILESHKHSFYTAAELVASELVSALRDSALAYLNRKKAELEQMGYIVQTYVSEGEVAQSINDIANKAQAHMIAMTTHGRSGIGRWALGSVADRLIRTAKQPILLVRAGVVAEQAEPSEAKGIPHTLKRILVPLDGSTVSSAALPLAQSLARQHDATLQLLTAIEPIDHTSELILLNQDFIQKAQAEKRVTAERYLDQMRRALRQTGIAYEYQAMPGQPAHVILNVAESEDFDLVVMSTHGRSGLNRWLYGSVASKVLHEITCPLLLVRGL